MPAVHEIILDSFRREPAASGTAPVVYPLAFGSRRNGRNFVVADCSLGCGSVLSRHGT
jgi:hypothetical protein